jgi:FkbM family methyltransferase
VEQESVEQLKAQFERSVGEAVKKMMAKGIWPGSPFWATAKTNEVYRIAEELGIHLTFDHDDKALNNAGKLRTIFLFRYNWFLYFLNWFYLLKDFCKKTHKLDGLKIWVGGVRSNLKMQDILRNYQVLEIYEPETTKLVKKHVKEGDTCVDIGASIGYFTLQFARIVGMNGKVVSIEPTDFQQPYLKKNIKINGFKNVKQFAVGAWDKDEVISHPLNAPEYVQTKLRCRPIDDLLEENGIYTVDFLKIDTDGAEPHVLRGLVRTIERSPHLKMVCEYYPKYVNDAGGSMGDVDAILKKYFLCTKIPGDYTDGCWNLFCEKK